MLCAALEYTSGTLAFLRDTKVGRAVTLASSLEEDEWDGLEEIELWPEEAGA